MNHLSKYFSQVVYAVATCTHTHTHTHIGKGMELPVVYAVDLQTDRQTDKQM